MYFKTWVNCHTIQSMVLAYFVNCSWHLRDHFEATNTATLQPFHVSDNAGML